MALTTLATVKTYLGLEDLNADTFLTSLIDQESAAFRGRTGGRNIEAANYTDTFDGDGNDERVLSNYPVISITSVTVDGVAIAAWVGTGDGYGFDATTGHVYLRGFSFAYGTRNCVIVYRAGFETVPSDVTAAVTMMVADAYKRPKRIGVMSESLGGEAVSYQTLTLPESVQAVVDAYRRF